jgi:DNA invertase Pin-like site-specific DNA recombinase
LRAEGVDKIYREKATAKTLKGRPQLEKAIDALSHGDVFVIAEWDRATRSMMDGITLIQRIAERGATLKVIDRPAYDLTTPLGQGIMAFMSALAEDDRERLARRAAEGRELAKAKGVKFGAKPKLSDHQRTLALERMAKGDTTREIARDMGVHHTTISRLKN